MTFRGVAFNSFRQRGSAFLGASVSDLVALVAKSDSSRDDAWPKGLRRIRIPYLPFSFSV